MAADALNLNRAASGRLTDEQFDSERAAVLDEWPTGNEIDFDEAVKFHRTLPDSKELAKLYTKAVSTGVPLVYPRTGEASLDRHIETLLYLYEQGAQLHCTTGDSYTRGQRFADAEKALNESLRQGISKLNGVPVVNYGPKRMREVIERTPIANQFRIGTPNARLASEVVLAAGYRSIDGGNIGMTCLGDKPIGELIHNWQYVDRLVGRYEEAGVTMHREFWGALMGMVMPPSIMCTSLIFDTLLAAEQGVRHISLGLNNNLHLCQDTATIRVLQKLSREYLDRFSYQDVEVTSILYMWMGAFPQDEARAYALITLGAFTAAYGGASAVIVKTAHEAFGTPDAEANAVALRLTRACLEIAGGQKYPDSQKLADEMDLIEQETRTLMEAALNLGHGAIGPSVEAAFAAGIIDIPLAPARDNAGKVIAARDAEGAVRFYDTGDLPFSDDIKEFHRRKIAGRAAKEHDNVNYKMVVRDLSMKAFDSRLLVGFE
jgi:methylaspartate mutase epsilon subunit